MSIPNACCNIKPPKSDYSPKGTTSKLGDVDVYWTGERGAKKAVVIIYDIFGLHPNTKQTADILASCGFRVAMPDIFRGNPWPEEKMPYDVKELSAWLGKAGAEDIVTKDLNATIKALKDEGSESIGSLGFCWGGIQICLASQKKLFKAIASAHPFNVDAKLAEIVTCPAFFLPSKDEADMTPVMEVLKKKPFGDKCEHKRFDDMHHGWCAGRSDFKNELNAQRTGEAISDIATFFKKNL